MPPPLPELIFSPESEPKVTEYTTDQFTSKMWIDPENRFVVLHTWHYEYFRNPEIAKRYGVPFGEGGLTRLAALRAGFIRINYERVAKFLTAESMRWNPEVRDKIDGLIVDNADAIDHARTNFLKKDAIPVQIGHVSLARLRWAGRRITKHNLGEWNKFRTVKIEGVS